MLNGYLYWTAKRRSLGAAKFNGNDRQTNDKQELFSDWEWSMRHGPAVGDVASAVQGESGPALRDMLSYQTTTLGALSLCCSRLILTLVELPELIKVF